MPNISDKNTLIDLCPKDLLSTYNAAICGLLSSHDTLRNYSVDDLINTAKLIVRKTYGVDFIVGSSKQ